MPNATERDNDRWESVLQQITELTHEIAGARGMWFSALGSLSLEVSALQKAGAETRAEMHALAADVKALTGIEQDCIERLTRLEAKEGINDKHRKAVLSLLIACGIALIVILYLAYRIAGVFGVV